MKSGMCQQKCSLRQEKAPFKACLVHTGTTGDKKMKTAVGLAGTTGFPYQLSPIKAQKGLEIPAVSFAETPASLKKIFKQNINNYVTPDAFFVTKFREIFQQIKRRHTTAAESKRWLGGPRMQYWPQELNFAVLVRHRTAEFHEKSLTVAWQCHRK